MFRPRFQSEGSLSSRSSEGSCDYPSTSGGASSIRDFKQIESYKTQNFQNYFTSNRTYTPQSLAMRSVMCSLMLPEESLFNIFAPPLVSSFYSQIRNSLRGILNEPGQPADGLAHKPDLLLKSLLPVLDSTSPIIVRPNVFNVNPGSLEEFYAGFQRLSMELNSVKDIYSTTPGKFMTIADSEEVQSFNSGFHALYLCEIISLSGLTSQKLTGSVCVEHPFNLARLYCGKCNRTVCVLCCLKVVGKHSHHIVTKKTNMNRTRAEIILRMVAILNDLIQIAITTIDAPLHVQLFVHFFGIPLFDTSKLKMAPSELITLLGILNWFITYTNMMTVGPPNSMDDFANILQNFSTIFKNVLGKA